MSSDACPGHRGEAYERLLRQERLILDVTEQLAVALDSKGVTRAELARRMCRTPGFVSQVLGGGRNLTLRTIADIAGALSIRPSFDLSGERTCIPVQPRVAIRVREETREIGRWNLRMPRVAKTAQPVERFAESVSPTKRSSIAAVA